MKEDRKVLNCKDIQSVLFDYISHDLGESQSVLVREHIRKCKVCSQKAVEFKETLTFLDMAKDIEIPPFLSDDRKSKINWVIMHPILRWLQKNHKIVSFAIMIIAIVVVLYLFKFISIQKNPLEGSVEVKVLTKCPVINNLEIKKNE